MGDLFVPEVENELGEDRGRDSREYFHDDGMRMGAASGRPMPEF